MPGRARHRGALEPAAPVLPSPSQVPAPGKSACSVHRMTVPHKSLFAHPQQHVCLRAPARLPVFSAARAPRALEGAVSEHSSRVGTGALLSGAPGDTLPEKGFCDRMSSVRAADSLGIKGLASWRPFRKPPRPERDGRVTPIPSVPLQHLHVTVSGRRVRREPAPAPPLTHHFPFSQHSEGKAPT